MTESRFSGKQVFGIVVAALVLLGIGLGAGGLIGYRWGQAEGALELDDHRREHAGAGVVQVVPLLLALRHNRQRGVLSLPAGKLAQDGALSWGKVPVHRASSQ